VTSIPPAYQRAFERWGYIADGEAHKYGLPNGATLLAKIAYVETRFSPNLKITSSAGAQGPMQFEPTTRAEFLKSYGVDAFASVDQAVHAGAIFMKTLGLDHYNAGSSTYVHEVLSAPVPTLGSTGPTRGTGASSSKAPAAAAATSSAPASASGLNGGIRFLLTSALVGGGSLLAAFGVTLMVGARGSA
jgi:hypothetical protein